MKTRKEYSCIKAVNYLHSPVPKKNQADPQCKWCFLLTVIDASPIYAP